MKLIAVALLTTSMLMTAASSGFAMINDWDRRGIRGRRRLLRSLEQGGGLTRLERRILQ